jgi:hypothetical protein
MRIEEAGLAPAEAKKTQQNQNIASEVLSRTPTQSNSVSQTEQYSAPKNVG